MAGPIQFGQIDWAELADANGIRKLRPPVVVTPADRLSASGPVEVVAITSRLPQPLPADHVLLPWHARGHPRTGLNRKCAAVCTWVARINPGDIQGIGGIVPGPVLLDILSKFAPAAPAPPASPPRAAEAETIGENGEQDAGSPPSDEGPPEGRVESSG
jgi:hypothetical protein